MPKKQPTRADLERMLDRLDTVLADHDRGIKDGTTIDFYNISDAELAALHAREEGSAPAHGNPFFQNEIESESDIAQKLPSSGDVGARGVRPGVGSANLPESQEFQNEIKTESNPAPAPPRKRGQKTKQGQIVASRNAIKHGIMSNVPVIDDFETMKAWEEHRDGIIDSTAPIGPLEENLVHRLASILWRLNRVTRFETASIKLDIAHRRERWRENEEARVELGEPPGDPAKLRAQIDYDALPDDDTTDKVIKYETHLHRQSIQLLHELEAMQARHASRGRKGQAVGSDGC